jgi:hypothetical protein
MAARSRDVSAGSPGHGIAVSSWSSPMPLVTAVSAWGSVRGCGAGPVVALVVWAGAFPRLVAAGRDGPSCRLRVVAGAGPPDAARSVQPGSCPDLFARLADGTGLVVDVHPDDRIGPRPHWSRGLALDDSAAPAVMTEKAGRRVSGRQGRTRTWSDRQAVAPPPGTFGRPTAGTGATPGRAGAEALCCEGPGSGGCRVGWPEWWRGWVGGAGMVRARTAAALRLGLLAALGPAPVQAFACC